jgi:hypothetical protein
MSSNLWDQGGPRHRNSGSYPQESYRLETMTAMFVIGRP